MSCFDTTIASPKKTLWDRLTSWAETPFDRRARFIAGQVAQLRALSDDELAELGIARDEILSHVFRGGRA